jgi:hypothetical protein
MKKCSKCKIEKDLVDFHRCKAKPDGYISQCKDCRNIGLSKHKDLIYLRSKEYYVNNKKKILNQINIRNKERRSIDPKFKLICNIRSLVNNSFRKNNSLKITKTQNILGCSFQEFKTYLESKFEPWMNWDNRGQYNGEFNYGWDLDHIIPISSANSIEEVIKLHHYTNFQPLCSKINRFHKKNKLGYVK